MTSPQFERAGNITVAAGLCLTSLAAVVAIDLHILLIPMWVAALPAGYVAVRRFLHTIISNAVCEGNLMAVDLMDDDGEYYGPVVEEDEGNAGPSVLDAETFARRADVGTAE